jgi:hypothetical protein
MSKGMITIDPPPVKHDKNNNMYLSLIRYLYFRENAANVRLEKSTVEICWSEAMGQTRTEPSPKLRIGSWVKIFFDFPVNLFCKSLTNHAIATKRSNAKIVKVLKFMSPKNE